ncbi:glycosyltransferase 87 family protein [Actinocorallia herbida]|uniref:glycosyltransferase 87 family protein n=1 Tax=Actinocorallia herbida TaxID=58109 RepID=UPI001476E021|nr:glycosyltransferase 87 family protein [Actinocorallia herbida]
MSAPDRRAVAVVPVLVAALVLALARTVTGGGTLGHSGPLDLWYPVDLVLFGCSVAALRRVRPGLVTAAVLVGCLAVLATGLLRPPRTSDDAYRYLWDGRVQVAGLSPYAHPPDDPRLAALRARAPELFPPGPACEGWDLRRARPGFCSHVNRPSVPTIYPPVAQGYFVVLYGLGGRFGVRAAQLGGAVSALVLCVLLLRLLPPDRRWQAALWGWFPGVALWAVNDAHVDVLGALLAVAGLAATARGRRAAGGALLGAAIATKILPALAVPGAMSGVLARRPRPGDLVVPGTAAAVCALVYLPYALMSGKGVLGYLGGYLAEEGYDSEASARFALIRLVVPDRFAAGAAVVVVAAAVLYVLRSGDDRRPWRGALLVSGVALLALTPSYPWYGLLIVALVVLDGRWEWLAVPVAAQISYLHSGWPHGVVFGTAAVVVAAGQAVRTGRRRSIAHGSTSAPLR